MLMVAGAYALSGPLPFQIARVDAETSEELLRQYAAKDTDTDGLPDWQEALYGTDPNDAESFKDGVRDGDAASQGLLTPRTLASQVQSDEPVIPGTLPEAGSVTDRFAKKFFAQYLSTRGTEPPSEDEILAFIQSAVDEIGKEDSGKAMFSAKDVESGGGTGKDALIAYSALVEVAFANNTTPTEKDELTYFKEALEKEDTAAFKRLGEISKAYAGIARAMIDVAPPKEAAAAHLRAANSLLAMSGTVEEMSMMEKDPLLAMVGLGRYEASAKEMIAAFAALSDVFAADGVTLTEGEPGFFIYRAALNSKTALTQAPQP